VWQGGWGGGNLEPVKIVARLGSQFEGGGNPDKKQEGSLLSEEERNEEVTGHSRQEGVGPTRWEIFSGGVETCLFAYKWIMRGTGEKKY